MATMVQAHAPVRLPAQWHDSARVQRLPSRAAERPEAARGIHGAAVVYGHGHNDMMTTHQAAFLSGAVAGCTAKTCTAPLSRLVVLLQTESLVAKSSHALLANSPSSGSGVRTVADTFRSIWQKGAPEFWKGNVLTCVHRFPYTGLNFLIVDHCTAQWGHRLSQWHFGGLVPGALAGVLSTFACYPLEVLRTRRMVMSGSEGFFAATRSILKEERLIGLYRGSTTAIVASVPSLAISFGVYPEVIKWLRRPKPGGRGVETPWYAPVVAGAAAGGVGSTLTYPFDLVRRRVQAMGIDATLRLQRRGAVAELQRIVHVEGPFGLFRGLSVELVKVFPTVGIMFWAKEHVCRLCLSQGGAAR